MAQCWLVDFIHDAQRGGYRFRHCNGVNDDYREALAIEIDLFLPAPRVIRVWDGIAINGGYR